MNPEEFKNMTKVKKILTVAKYIIENNATIEQTALNFGISTLTIEECINGDYGLESINPKAYAAVKKIEELNNKKITESNEQYKISEFDAEEIARIIIENRLTLQEASLQFDGIPASIIFEALTGIYDEGLKAQLYNLFETGNIAKGGRR